MLSIDDVNQLKLNMQLIEHSQKFMLTDLIKKACTKYRLSRESAEVLGLVDAQIRIYNAEIESEQSFIRYSSWAIPSVGFSRRHAAIIREDDNWKLVQLSQTNSTFLNGVSIKNEWYLQSGDEIQLSTNGPKLSFIIPQGDKGLVKSIGMTARLNLFRQQAMRPYKNVIATIAAVLAVCLIAGTFVILRQHNELSQLNSTLASTTQEFNDQMQQMQQRRQQDSIDNEQRIAQDREQYQQQIREMQQRNRQRGFSIAQLIQQQHIEESIYFLWSDTIFTVSSDGRETQIDYHGWSGTGFLLSDGRFVTARHCIEGGLYNDPTDDDELVAAARMSTAGDQRKIKTKIYAISSTRDILEFSTDNFTIDRSHDRIEQFGTDDNGNPLYWRFPLPFDGDCDPAMDATDWAYVKTSRRGKIDIDKQLSQNLLPMQELIAFGFPQGLGVLDDPNSVVQPISSEMKASRKGLATNGCIMHSAGLDHGNSGGPVFTIDNNDKLVCVGIASSLDGRTTKHCWSVPVSRLK